MKRSFFKSLFAEHQVDLQRFITRKFGNTHDAEDIVQDAFHNVLQKEDFHKMENPRAYLFQAAHNIALNQIRKRHHHNEYIADQDGELPTPQLENAMSARSDLEAVQKSLGLLPEKCREAFIMSRIHAKTYTEIAETLGVSVSSVEKYLIRALKFLRTQLDET